MYVKIQEEHVKLLGMREKEKIEMQKLKIQQQKEQRDRQLAEEKKKRKVDEKNSFKQEVELVERLQKEMEAERILQL